MELRFIWTLFKRRWLIAIIPALVVLVVALVTYQSPPDVYNVGVRFMVAQAPTTAAASEDEERLANWQTSEYIVNGLNDWVRGTEFAEAVSEELARKGLVVYPIVVQRSLAADNVRSMLTISLTYGDTATVGAMMEAVITVLTEQNAAALPQLGGETAVVTPLDLIFVQQIPGGLRSQLDLPLRIALAIGAGIGLALLVEYLDPTLHDRKEVEGLGVSVLGEIPKK